MTGEHSGSTNDTCSFRGRLENKYALVIEGNKATASDGGKSVVAIMPFRVHQTRILKYGPSTGVSNIKVKALRKFTDSNLAAELKETCLFTLTQREMALAAVAAEDN